MLYFKAVVSMRMSTLPLSGCKLNVRVDHTAPFFLFYEGKKFRSKENDFIK